MLAGELVSAAPTTLPAADDDDEGENCDDARTKMMSKILIRGVFVNGNVSMQMRVR